MYPVLGTILGSEIYSYPLFLGLAIGMAFNLSRSLFCIHSRWTKKIAITFWISFFSAWFGAKIFFLLFSTGKDYFLFAESPSFWLGGGFVFYGGLIAGLISMLVCSLAFKMISLKDCSLFLAPLALAHGIGRLGCFLAGCCFGIETTSFLGVHMHGSLRHPTQLYESLCLFILSFVIFKSLKARKPATRALIIYFYSYSILRFFIEFFRGDRVRGIYEFGLSTSQFVSMAILILLSLVLFFRRVFGKRNFLCI